MIILIVCQNYVYHMIIASLQSTLWKVYASYMYNVRYY